MLGNIYTFKTKNFTIKVDALEEYESLDSLYGDCDIDLEELATSLDNGDAVLFCAHAYIIGPAGEILAEDYLGSCCYESLQDFRTSRPGYFSDMVRNVCEAGRKEYNAQTRVNLRTMEY